MSQFSGFMQLSYKSREERSPWMIFSQVVHGRPGGRLQISGGGSKVTWLASAFSPILTNIIHLRTLMLVIILQVLSNFIPVYLSVILSMHIFVRRFFCRCKRLQRPADRLPPGAYVRTAVCVVYFPAHCAGVTNISLHYNLFPL